MANSGPVFSAVSSSPRQLLMLLRCISTAKKAQVRLTSDGIRFSTEQGSIMESFVFFEKALFTSYKYNAPPPPSSQDDPQSPIFEVSLMSLLETLNIFSLSDPNANKRPGGDSYDAFAAHRLNRHAGINAFSNSALGVSGVCSLTYDGEGSPLSIHMSESGVTTTCDLTTYEADTAEEIPFDRDAIRLKAIIRSYSLLDAITELGSMSPEHVTITASPASRTHQSDLSLFASGALGSATVDFTVHASSDTPILETFYCPSKIAASFKFTLIKSAQRAMGFAQKVSLRLDEEGVLSMQFLVQVEEGNGGSEGAAFVDFRVVPLVEGEGDIEGRGLSASDSD